MTENTSAHTEKGKAMSDYIKRDALRQKMYHESFETDTDLQKWDSGCWIRYKLFEKVIDSIPSADVVERKRGEWIFDDPIRANFKCSECLERNDICSKFCPNCGADMRERKDNE